MALSFDTTKLECSFLLRYNTCQKVSMLDQIESRILESLNQRQIAYEILEHDPVYGSATRAKFLKTDEAAEQPER